MKFDVCHELYTTIQSLAISKLSRYTINLNKAHCLAMKRVLGYLDDTQNYALHYNKYPTVLGGYSDLNFPSIE